MSNQIFADALNEIAALLEIRGDNPFRIRAFQRAARAVDGLAEPLEERLDAGTATEIDGVGKSIALDLFQLRDRGSCEILDELRRELPAGLIDVLRVQGLGPKKVGRLWHELGVTSLEELERAALDDRIAALDGFGPKSQQKIVDEIARLRKSAGRTPVARAWPIAQNVVERMRKVPQVERFEIAGSLRRGRETVKDLDFVCASRDPAAVTAAFVGLAEVEQITGSGDTKTSVYMRGGLSADLRIVPPEVFGATLHHFTGSKDHNVEMRARAVRLGLRVSEWGVFERSTDGGDERLVACATENDIFAAVGLPYIPPELREGRGEIAAAEQHALPELISLDAIKGDLHMHTTDSDGRHEIAAMASAAHALGLHFICITDHSRSLTVANGLSRERLLAQLDRIDAYNAAGGPVRVLKGLEVDILEHGELDMDSDVLERLDWVVGSVHSRMNQPRDVMTARLLNAIGSGLVSAIGHPTGRLLGGRDGYDFDLDAVIAECARMGVALEVNASPERLDLDDRMLRRTLENPAVWITINTDAHSTDNLSLMHFGVRMARRGWVPQSRVLNALPLSEFLATRRAPKRAAH
jgi:DNA polymerase (family 10)